MSELTEYERERFARIQAWKAEPPGVVGQVMDYVTWPVSWLFSKIIPHSVINALLNASDWMGELTIAQGVGRVSEDAGLKERDVEADSVQNWAIGYAIAEGGAAGSVGIASLPLDIPAVITLSLRTIRRIGICYGFDDRGEKERQFVLSILAAAGSNSIKEKAGAITTLRTLQTTLAKKSWKLMTEQAAEHAIGKEAALIAIRDLAKQLGFNLTKRKALAAIPLIGAVVGASLNGWYLRDVGLAAQYAYQERWLRQRGLVIDQDGLSERETTSTDPNWVWGTE